MELEEILKVIDDETEFILYKGDRIGKFLKTDIALQNYETEKVWAINIENQTLTISLEY